LLHEDLEPAQKKQRISESKFKSTKTPESKSDTPQDSTLNQNIQPNPNNANNKKSNDPSEDPDYEDILVSGWFYLDAEGNKQGPFMTTEIRDWFIDGFFTRELKVKRVYEENFSRMSDRDEFKNLKQKPIRHISYLNDYYADPNWSFYQGPPASNVPDDGSYAQNALFNLNGKFATTDANTHWRKKGLPEDKEGRMMAHYFDVESYQEQMRNLKQNPPKKRKVTKKMIQFYKKKKEDKKKRRILMI